VFKKILKWVLNAGLAVLGIAVVLAGLELLVNSRLFDEAPNPEIAAFMQIEASRVPDEQNAYFQLVGLAAPESAQPHAAGKQWLAEVNDVQARHLKGDFAKWPAALPGAAYLPQDPCRPEVRSCLAQARANPEEMRKLVAANERLLARYRAAYGYPGYAETAEVFIFEYPLSSFGPILNGQRLFLMDAALRIDRGELQAVIADLGKEIAFSRRMLAGSRTLIGKMIAGRHLNRAVLFAADVLANRREQAGAGARELQSVLQPLTPAERELGDVMRYEARLMKTGMEHNLRYPSRYDDAGYWAESWIGRALLQFNATFNNVYLSYKASQLADKAPASQMDAVLSKGKSAIPVPPDWTLFYNPVGKMQVQDMVPNLSEYTRRMHDLDALVRLVALQAEIVAKSVKDEDVPQFLAAADKLYANPWTEKPMQWDPKARQIYFEPRTQRYRDDKTGGVAGRVSISL